ncbi:hypothetical protein ACVWWP_007526 [Bradyrhizobium sp. LM3.6]
MKYADEYRDKEIALGLAKAIRSKADPEKS